MDDDIVPSSCSGVIRSRWCRSCSKIQSVISGGVVSNNATCMKWKKENSVSIVGFSTSCAKKYITIGIIAVIIKHLSLDSRARKIPPNGEITPQVNPKSRSRYIYICIYILYVYICTYGQQYMRSLPWASNTLYTRRRRLQFVLQRYVLVVSTQFSLIH